MKLDLGFSFISFFFVNAEDGVPPVLHFSAAEVTAPLPKCVHRFSLICSCFGALPKVF